MLKNTSLFSLGFLLIACIFSTSGYAQKQLKHEKKVFKSKDGKIYWNKSLPVYVRLATSPDDKGLLMESQEFPEYTNPYYFDTEGENYIRTRYAVDKETKQPVIPQVEVLWEVYADGIAPKSGIHYGTKNLYNVEGLLYIGPGLDITLTSKDEMSGLANIYYSVNGGEYKVFKDKIILDGEKEATIKYYAVDKVGNVEAPKELRVSTDFTAPTTTHTVGGDHTGNILSRKTTLTLSSKDELAGVSRTYYTIDGGKEMVYGSKLFLSWLTEGDHEITYYSKDNVNNIEKVNSFKFFIDRSAPKVTASISDDFHKVNGKTYYSSRTKLNLTAVDNKAGVKSIFYSMNGSEYQEFVKPVNLPVNSSTLSIKSYALDKVNNASSKNAPGANLNLYSDLSGPSLSMKYTGPTFETRDTIFICNKTKVNLFAADSKSGVQKITYQINKSADKTYSAPFTVEKEDFYKVDFKGYDNVNNTNDNAFFFYVDNTGPVPYTRFSIEPIGTKVIEGKTVNIYPKHTVLFLSATDAHVGFDKIFYSLNGGTEKLYTGAVKYFKNGMVYTIKMRAYDTLGNVQEKEEIFMIENK